MAKDENPEPGPRDVSQEEKIAQLEAQYRELKALVDWLGSRKGEPAGCYCKICTYQLHYTGGMSTCVGFCYPGQYEGHNHDNNSKSYTFECLCGETHYHPRNECPICPWVGTGCNDKNCVPVKDLPYHLGYFIRKKVREDADRMRR